MLKQAEYEEKMKRVQEEENKVIQNEHAILRHKRQGEECKSILEKEWQG